MELQTVKTKICGVDVEMAATVIEMPWGSIYWLIEARMERPILPHIFRRIGEKEWVACEPTQDSALAKIEQYIAGDVQ